MVTYGCAVCLVDPLIGELKRFMRESCVYSVALVISSIHGIVVTYGFSFLWLVFILPLVAWCRNILRLNGLMIP